jgi:phosphoglycerol transferase
VQIKDKYKNLLFFLLYFSFFMIAAVYTLCEKFKIYTFEQILFHLSQPMGSLGPVYARKIAVNTAWESVAMFVLTLFIMAFVHYKTSKPGKKFSFKYVFSLGGKTYMNILFVSLCACLAFMVIFAMVKLKGVAYINQLFTPPTKYYEENYVYPSAENIKFPRKNNLIIIHLESFEKTYFDREIFKEDLIPNVREMSAKYLSFSGFKQASGSEWTIGGLFSAYCGAPLKVVISQNEYGKFKSFFSNITCFPEILKQNGYRTYYMQGGDLPFSGKGKFLSQHGFLEVYGLDEFRARGDYKDEYNAIWSVNDAQLFEYAKEKLTAISRKKGPFFLAFLTGDTHSPDCFLNKNCARKFDNALKNTLCCTDAHVGDFMAWVKKQDFYKDTTIIILGDHLSMRNELYDSLLLEKNRELVNIFINPLKKAGRTDRVYCTLDLMPTIIESMGGEVEGGRLGLGTSLFSGKKTLVEEQGFDAFNRDIYAKSRMYESFR